MHCTCSGEHTKTTVIVTFQLHNFTYLYYTLLYLGHFLNNEIIQDWPSLKTALDYLKIRVYNTSNLSLRPRLYTAEQTGLIQALPGAETPKTDVCFSRDGSNEKVFTSEINGLIASSCK